VEPVTLGDRGSGGHFLFRRRPHEILALSDASAMILIRNRA